MPLEVEVDELAALVRLHRDIRNQQVLDRRAGGHPHPHDGRLLAMSYPPPLYSDDTGEGPTRCPSWFVRKLR